MAETEKPRSRRIGCALVVVVAVALVIGGGLWLGRRDDASMTPCQRYARTIVRALDNCSSGVTRQLDHHVAVCQQSITPTAACLERVESLSCPELEQGPASSAPALCRKVP